MNEKRSDSESEKKSVKENGNYRKKSGRDKEKLKKLQKLNRNQVLKLVIKLLKKQISIRKLLIILNKKRAQILRIKKVRRQRHPKVLLLDLNDILIDGGTKDQGNLQKVWNQLTNWAKICQITYIQIRIITKSSIETIERKERTILTLIKERIG